MPCGERVASVSTIQRSVCPDSSSPICATVVDRFFFAYQDIHAATGIPYRDMLFFDDEKSNITTVSKLGVTSVILSKESGLTFAAVDSGLKQYREACLSRASLKGWLTLAPRKNEAEGSGQSSENSYGGLVEDPTNEL